MDIIEQVHIFGLTNIHTFEPNISQIKQHKITDAKVHNPVHIGSFYYLACSNLLIKISKFPGSCNVGYGTTVTGGTCTACPVGTYKDTVANTACTNCPADKSTGSTGRTSLGQCM